MKAAISSKVTAFLLYLKDYRNTRIAIHENDLKTLL